MQGRLRAAKQELEASIPMLEDTLKDAVEDKD